MAWRMQNRDKNMNQADNIIPTLRQLAALRVDMRGLAVKSPHRAQLIRQIDSLRAVLPTVILGHHDRLRERGKMTVAAVSNGVCGACHLVLPRSRVLDLHRPGNALNVCDNCGVFIYLADEDQVPDITDEPAASKPPRKPRVKTSPKQKAVRPITTAKRSRRARVTMPA